MPVIVQAALRDITYRVFYRPADILLETFYLPTLAASVHYDRSAGYFRWTAYAWPSTPTNSPFHRRKNHLCLRPNNLALVLMVKMKRCDPRTFTN